MFKNKRMYAVGISLWLLVLVVGHHALSIAKYVNGSAAINIDTLPFNELGLWIAPLVEYVSGIM